VQKNVPSFSSLLFFSLVFFCPFQLLIWNFRQITRFYEGKKSAVSELSPDVLSKEGQCIICRARPFRTANSTPFTATSRNLAQFDKAT
jgi:hypothetical protein